MQRWGASDNFVGQLTYSTANAAHLLISSFQPWKSPSQIYHLNGDWATPNDRMGAFVNVATQVVTGGAGNAVKPTLGLARVASGTMAQAARGLTSIVKQNASLLRLARETFAGNDLLRKEANSLIKQLSQGNINPGIGTKNIGKNIFEARSRGGARVYFRNSNDAIEILGYSNKSNQQSVINLLLELY